MTNEFNPDWMCVCGDLTTLGVVHRKDGPCYYPEPKREWVGLTEQDRKNIHAMWVETDELTDEQDVIDVVERLLKEKNT